MVAGDADCNLTVCRGLNLEQSMGAAGRPTACVSQPARVRTRVDGSGLHMAEQQGPSLKSFQTHLPATVYSLRLLRKLVPGRT